MIIKVDQDNIGERLDIFLTKKLEDKTRSQIKKMVVERQILINNKPAKVHQFLKQNDEIEIAKAKEKPRSIIKKILPTKIIAPKIIFEDDNYLVIDKPVGLLVHPTSKNENNTLVNWLIKKYPKIKNVGDDPNRAGIVHRLDRDVSGIMVVAKTNNSWISLKKQFKDRKVDKHYIAIVYGKSNQPEGEINLPIGRNKEGQFVAHPLKGDEKFQNKDKVAKTKYKVLEYINDYSILDVEIFTGRTHQIRAHLSAIGHPILGDKMYQPKKKFFIFLRRRIKVLDLPRIFLHSKTLGFKNLDDEYINFESSLPQEIAQFINDKKNGEQK